MNIESKIGNLKFQQPLWLWPILLPLAMAYRLGIVFRNTLFKLGLSRIHSAMCPVISVGNLTVGGTGKTPLIDFLLRVALEAGKKPVVISRGYGRRGGDIVVRVKACEGWPPDAAVLGDEPALLARRHPQVPVYVCRRRARAARLAEAWDKPDLILLDDAFQHRGLARDLNLLLIDAGKGLGNGRLLPFGPLREPPSALERADVVLLTKPDTHKTEVIRAGWRNRIPETTPVFLCPYVPRGITALEGNRAWVPDSLQGKRVSLVCGIADPGGFSRTVHALGGEVGEQWAFGDHHAYQAPDLARLDAALAESARHASTPDGPPRWLTTGKDAVKLRGRLIHGQYLGVLEMEMLPEPAARAFFFDFISKGGIK